MFHTIYLSFEEDGRDYIGKHTTTNPYDDYLGSFKDKSFNPDNKIVFAYAKTKEGAVWLEMMFQRVFGVVKDPQFANQSYQTSTGFDTTGRNHTKQDLQKLSDSLRRAFAKPEVKARRSAANKGENNPRFGYVETEEEKEIRAQSISRFYSTDTGFDQQSVKTKGTLWWYNPKTKERKRQKGCPGTEWEQRKGPDKLKG